MPYNPNSVRGPPGFVVQERQPLQWEFELKLSLQFRRTPQRGIDVFALRQRGLGLPGRGLDLIVRGKLLLSLYSLPLCSLRRRSVLSRTVWCFSSILYSSPSAIRFPLPTLQELRPRICCRRRSGDASRPSGGQNSTGSRTSALTR